jgi:hypothetical protein
MTGTDIKFNFKYRGIIEIVQLCEFDNLVKNEMKMQRLYQLINDLQDMSVISGKNYELSINNHKRKIQAITRNQDKSVAKYDNSKPPKEVIVVFSRLNFRKQCLDDYYKYSHWWSRSKSMPEKFMLQGKYSFKVKPAPEPFEIDLE